MRFSESSEPNPNPNPYPNPNPNPNQALAAVMGNEMAHLERQASWAAVRAVLSVRQTTLLLRLSHCWRVWSLAASLPVLGLGLGPGLGLGLGLGLGFGFG